MFTIRINKSPVSHVEIPDNLEYIKIYYDKESKEEKSEKYYSKTERLYHSFTPCRPEEGYLADSEDYVEVYGLRDVKHELEKDPSYKFYQNLQTRGIQHTIEIPLFTLKNYLNDEQYFDIKNHVQRKLEIVRTIKAAELKRDAPVRQAVNSLLSQYSGLPYLLEKAKLIDSNISKQMYDTRRALEDIRYHDGNIEKSDVWILTLFLNEGLVDKILRSIKNVDENAELIKKLLTFQKELKTFATINKSVITYVIENEIQRNIDPAFRKAYEYYKASKNHRKNVPSEYIKLDDMFMGGQRFYSILNPMFFAPDKMVRQSCQNQLDGVDISDDEMLQSAFGKACSHK